MEGLSELSRCGVYRHGRLFGGLGGDLVHVQAQGSSRKVGLGLGLALALSDL